MTNNNTIFFDTEFIEDGRTIELISIGLAHVDGRELYLENAECDHSRADPWVKANVITHLQGGSCRMSRQDMRRSIFDFCGQKPEFWAYYADYDWVVLCQLFGRMIDLPNGWPMYCRDLKQEADRISARLPKQIRKVHHALADAMWVRDCAKKLLGGRDDQ